MNELASPGDDGVSPIDEMKERVLADHPTAKEDAVKIRILKTKIFQYREQFKDLRDDLVYADTETRNLKDLLARSQDEARSFESVISDLRKHIAANNISVDRRSSLGTIMNNLDGRNVIRE